MKDLNFGPLHWEKVWLSRDFAYENNIFLINMKKSLKMNINIWKQGYIIIISRHGNSER